MPTNGQWEHKISTLYAGNIPFLRLIAILIRVVGLCVGIRQEGTISISSSHITITKSAYSLWVRKISEVTTTLAVSRVSGNTTSFVKYLIFFRRTSSAIYAGGMPPIYATYRGVSYEEVMEKMADVLS
tara:strand:- start:891 stop:1274 length:384 start_codon:yes stop_codon:yes gene_type:complete